MSDLECSPFPPLLSIPLPVCAAQTGLAHFVQKQENQLYASFWEQKMEKEKE